MNRVKVQPQKLIFHDDGEIQGKSNTRRKGKLVSETRAYISWTQDEPGHAITVRWPGRSQITHRGLRYYEPAKFITYKVLERTPQENGTDLLLVQYITDHPVRPKKG